MASGSASETWLAATMRPPSRGTCSRPCQRSVISSRSPGGTAAMVKPRHQREYS